MLRPATDSCAVARVSFFVLLHLTFVVPAAPVLAANIWVVNSTGIGDDFPSIQAAIASGFVVSGDEIHLRDGVYTGPGNRDINFMGKNVVVQSMFLDPSSCIIDCQGSEDEPHRGFLFTSGETLSATIRAVTIRNGCVLHEPGAGIFIENASATIDNCIIENCWALHSNGGGIHATSNTLRPLSIRNCVIRNNVCGGLLAGAGGGIHVGPGVTADISDCVVVGNRADHRFPGGAFGGGIYISEEAVIVGCSIRANRAEGDGGVSTQRTLQSTTATSTRTMLRGSWVWAGVSA